MEICDNLKKEFASSALKTFCFSGFDSDKAIRDQLKELEERLELNSSEVAQSRCDYFKVQGTDPKHYLEKLFESSSGGKILAGIRHAGGNIEKPFISIETNFEVSSLDELKDIAGTISPSFKIFSPKHLAVWASPSSALGKKLEEKILPSRRYMVASVSQMKKRTRPKKYDEIEFKRVVDESYRHWYEEAYAEFHSEAPELQDWVPINDKSEMSQSIEDKLMCEVFFNGKRGGLIAACREPLLGAQGIYFLEILVRNPFKRKGYAPAIQRCFIENMLNDDVLVWGTIDAKNIASTKTALRVGRVPVRNEFFVPLSDFEL